MRKTEINQKTDKQTNLGTTFLAKKRIFSDFGVPGRSLGKALGRILAGKFGDEKKVRKKVVKVIASAGDADPGKEGFREDKGQVGKIQHAFAHPSDGRADCLRFASPAEALGGWRLGGWRLGGLEVLRLRGWLSR